MTDQSQLRGAAAMARYDGPIPVPVPDDGQLHTDGPLGTSLGSLREGVRISDSYGRIVELSWAEAVLMARTTIDAAAARRLL